MPGKDFLRHPVQLVEAVSASRLLRACQGSARRTVDPCLVGTVRFPPHAVRPRVRLSHRATPAP